MATSDGTTRPTPGRQTPLLPGHGARRRREQSGAHPVALCAPIAPLAPAERGRVEHNTVVLPPLRGVHGHNTLSRPRRPEQPIA